VAWPYPFFILLALWYALFNYHIATLIYKVVIYTQLLYLSHLLTVKLLNVLFICKTDTGFYNLQFSQSYAVDVSVMQQL